MRSIYPPIGYPKLFLISQQIDSFHPFTGYHHSPNSSTTVAENGFYVQSDAAKAPQENRLLRMNLIVCTAFQNLWSQSTTIDRAESAGAEPSKTHDD